MDEGWIRKTLDLTGVVQGVGLRPALYRLARAERLGGWVQNRVGSVRLVLEGPVSTVNDFIARLPKRLPSPARLEFLTVVAEESLVPEDLSSFTIRASGEGTTHEVLIPPDLAVCPDCTREFFNPADRRYGYSFTTCTRCGPRYTVLNAMPYDRERTTMKAFPLCPECRNEYTDPMNRRFHAESMACPVCGPRLWMEEGDGKRIEGDPLRLARAALARGERLAVRGIGGFLLAVDAFNRDAVMALRERKARPHKPFAVMARDLATLAKVVRISPEAESRLASPEAPIVILDVLPEAIAKGRLPIAAISPDTLTLGVMLPTSPLHHGLMAPLRGDPVPAFDLLIMTSGNRRGEPVCIRNEEARDRLAGIADGFLMHDREINLRNDDSVCVIRGSVSQVWRRARGYAPVPVTLGMPLRRVVLAMGADMKNAVAVGYDRSVVLSPHVGDLDTPEAVGGCEQVVRTLPEFLGRVPDVVAVDRHPDMQSSRLGRAYAHERKLRVVEVQHHHAHAAACLAENGLRDGLALVMDGTGWGGDGSIWGAELLAVHGDGTFRRCASFEPVPLPGGDAAVRRPARQVIGRWIQAGIPLTDERLAGLGVTREEAGVWERQCAKQVNAPPTHAAGRLLDSFAVLLSSPPSREDAPGDGGYYKITYEGQPAIRLETEARKWREGAVPELPFDVIKSGEILLIDWAPAFRMLAGMAIPSHEVPRWAMAVHVAVARAATVMIESEISRMPEKRVCLTGGVFMNRILNDLLEQSLGLLGIKVLRHQQTPPGDGCSALGQAVVVGTLKSEM